MQDFHFLPFGNSERTHPTVCADNTGKYLQYGNRNDFLEELIHLSSQSSTHQSILELKTALIVGDGWMLPKDAKLPKLIDGILLQKLAYDLALFQGFAIQVIWSVDGKAIAALHAIPFQNIRCGIPDRLGKVDTFYHSSDWQAWEQSRKAEFEPKPIQVYNPDLRTEFPRQLFYYAQYNASTKVYPFPAYCSALGDIKFEHEYQQYKLASIKNGMFPGLHIEVEGLPSEEERDAFYKAVEKKFTGPQQAGRILITYGLDQAGRTKVSPIPQQAGSDLFLTWAEDARQRIITAHRLSSPVLAGIPRSGGLGNSGSEISTAFEHFYNAVIRAMQNEIIKTVLLFAPYLESSLDGLEIANVKPLKYVFSEQIIAQVLSGDELRQELGYAPIGLGILKS